MDYHLLDYLNVMIITIIIVTGTLLILRKHQKAVIGPRIAIAGGIVLLIVITILNSAAEHKWDMSYILSFLCLKRVSTKIDGYYARSIVSVSYAVIYLGCLQALFARNRN